MNWRESLAFEGVGATSAGATNGAVLAYGLAVRGGTDLARRLRLTDGASATPPGRVRFSLVRSTLASACLRAMFRAVEIDGEAYWDGGYIGNPTLFPLSYNCRSADILIVHLNPLHRSEIPRTADEILNRINENSLNAVSKYNPDWDFIAYLRDEGQRCASDWFAKNFSRLGVESTVDIDQNYL